MERVSVGGNFRNEAQFNLFHSPKGQEVGFRARVIVTFGVFDRAQTKNTCLRPTCIYTYNVQIAQMHMHHITIRSDEGTWNSFQLILRCGWCPTPARTWAKIGYHGCARCNFLCTALYFGFKTFFCLFVFEPPECSGENLYRCFHTQVCFKTFTPGSRRITLLLSL